ncbi:MAG: chromate resistance protein ChrB domain-containing protein, partial [Pseudolabrys sp.]
ASLYFFRIASKEHSLPEYVKVDRVACPWLIKKFVDKSAEFIFVPADKVMAEAKRLDAIPYDVKTN